MAHHMRQLQSILKKNTVFLTNIVIAGYFIYLQWGAGFADPDSFYHAGVGKLMGQGQIIFKQFPWFTFTTFSEHFTDHQFFYHLLLAPFTLLASPLLATKIVSVILAILFFIVFNWLLKQIGIRHRIFYLIILLTTTPFVFRLNLAKAGSLALILLFAGIYALWHNKNTLLFLITFLYVWTHAGWMSMGVIYLLWFITRLLTTHALSSDKNFLRMSTKCIRALTSDRALWAIVSGMFFGILINPYFPNNLKFYWQQAVKIGLVNYQSTVNVGMEWFPMSLSTLAVELLGVWIVCAFALILFFMTCMQTKKIKLAHDLDILFIKVLHITMIAGLWFTLTLKSARYVEYLAPSALLSSALLIKLSIRLGGLTHLKKYLRQHYTMYRACACVCVIFYIAWSANGAQSLKKYLSNTFSWTRFQAPSAYLAANTAHSSLIFNTNWSYSPLLFFHNTKNRYMAGLDPTFFYLANSNLYRRYADIARGRVHKPAEVIYKTFKTPYILINLPDDWFLNYQLKKEPRVKVLFHDEESIVYQYMP